VLGEKSVSVPLRSPQTARAAFEGGKWGDPQAPLLRGPRASDL